MIFRYLENFLGRYLMIDIMSKPLLRLPSNSLHCFNTLISPIIFLLFFEITIITFWCFWETLRKFYDEIYAHTIGPKVLTILFRFGELFFCNKKASKSYSKSLRQKKTRPYKVDWNPKKHITICFAWNCAISKVSPLCINDKGRTRS